MIVDSTRPLLRFSGLTPLFHMRALAGQFVWAVQYTTDEGVRITPWFVNVPIDLTVDRVSERLVRAKLFAGLRSVESYISEIMTDAQKGLVSTGRYVQILNPTFNPDLPETSALYVEDDEIWNPRMISGPEPIQEKFHGLKMIGYPDEPFDAWNLDALVDREMTRIRKYC